jgi:hypothetical protein
MSDDLTPYDLEAPAHWVMAPSMLVMWERCPESEGYVPPDPLPEKCFMAGGGFMVHVRSDRECQHER